MAKKKPPKMKVLIIDDEEQLRLLVKLNIERTGLYEVFTAANGEEGLKKVEKHDPDVVVLDVTMPGMNGFEVLQALRKPGIKWRPVIMLTAKNDPQSVLTGYDLKSEQYITKPFKIADLLRNLEILAPLKSVGGMNQ